jgi:hypothetical protein
MQGIIFNSQHQPVGNLQYASLCSACYQFKCIGKTMEQVTIAHLYMSPNPIIAYQHTIMKNKSTDRLHRAEYSEV